MVNENGEFVTFDGNQCIYVDRPVTRYETNRFQSGMSVVTFYLEGSEQPTTVKIDTADVTDFCAYLRGRSKPPVFEYDDDGYGTMGDMSKR